MKKIINISTHSFNEIKYYTDSQIVLAWIKAPPDRWKSFVAHRVSKIQDLCAPNQWSYVKSANNPADIISRGSTVAKLKNSKLWWQNVAENVIDEEQKEVINENNLPERKIMTLNIVISRQFCDDLIKRYSNFDKLIRVVAYCLRFIHNLKNVQNKQLGKLKVEEYEHSELIIVKLMQKAVFNLEIASLKKRVKLVLINC